MSYNDTINTKIINMRVDNNPIVLINTLFKVSDTITDVEGFWLDSNEKVHFDYIIPVSYPVICSFEFNTAIDVMLNDGEICVFSKDVHNYGVLHYKNNKKEVIKKRMESIRTVRPCEGELKKLLKQYGGLTLYRIADNCYVIEIYNLNYGGDTNE
jgi:hypothetical protein